MPSMWWDALSVRWFADSCCSRSSGEHWSVLLLALPWFAMAFPSRRARGYPTFRRAAAYGILFLALLVLLATKDFETQFPVRRVLRDSTATVIAARRRHATAASGQWDGDDQAHPITKMMAHMTLASLDHTPHSALVICFGMGTTFRSVLRGIFPVPAVELVPSVPKLFSYYHADAPQVMASPLAHVVIDDGRRFLERSPAKYDAIIVDPLRRC